MVESNDVEERHGLAESNNVGKTDRMVESIDGMSFSFVLPSVLQRASTYFLDVMHFLGFLRLVLFSSCKKDKERD